MVELLNTVLKMGKQMGKDISKEWLNIIWHNCKFQLQKKNEEALWPLIWNNDQEMLSDKKRSTEQCG